MSVTTKLVNELNELGKDIAQHILSKEKEIARLNDRVLELEENQFSIIYHLRLDPDYELAVVALLNGYNYKSYIVTMLSHYANNAYSSVRTLSAHEYNILRYVVNAEHNN